MAKGFFRVRKTAGFKSEGRAREGMVGLRSLIFRPLGSNTRSAAHTCAHLPSYQPPPPRVQSLSSNVELSASDFLAFSPALHSWLWPHLPGSPNSFSPTPIPPPSLFHFFRKPSQRAPHKLHRFVAVTGGWREGERKERSRKKHYTLDLCW